MIDIYLNVIQSFDDTGTWNEEKIKSLIQVFINMIDELSAAGAERLVAEVTMPIETLIMSFGKEIQPLTTSTIKQWINRNIPLLPSIISSWLARKCFSTRQGSYERPLLNNTFSILCHDIHLLCLSLQTVELQTTWESLYSSLEDGLSFNRVCHHILGYQGPTVILCQDSHNGKRGFTLVTLV